MKGKTMALFMDVHQKAPEGAKAKDVADAHMADVKTQGKYGVQYLRYWFDEKNGKIFCLVDAEDRSEEHTSELQSRLHLVCRLLLEKKKKNTYNNITYR